MRQGREQFDGCKCYPLGELGVQPPPQTTQLIIGSPKKF
jgi:hypothetical protein